MRRGGRQRRLRRRFGVQRTGRGARRRGATICAGSAGGCGNIGRRGLDGISRFRAIGYWRWKGGRRLRHGRRRRRRRLNCRRQRRLRLRGSAGWVRRNRVIDVRRRTWQRGNGRLGRRRGCLCGGLSGQCWRGRGRGTCGPGCRGPNTRRPGCGPDRRDSRAATGRTCGLRLGRRLAASHRQWAAARRCLRLLGRRILVDGLADRLAAGVAQGTREILSIGARCR